MDAAILHYRDSRAERAGGERWDEIFSVDLGIPIYTNREWPTKRDVVFRSLDVSDLQISGDSHLFYPKRIISDYLVKQQIKRVEIPYEIIITFGNNPWAYYHREHETNHTHILAIHNTFPRYFENVDNTVASKPSIIRPISRWYYNVYRRHVQDSLDNVDLVIANSHYTKNWWKSEVSTEVPVEIINPPVNTKQYIEFQPSYEQLDEIPEDYFVYVGRLVEWKGVLELLDVFQNSPYNLVVAGDGPLREQVTNAHQTYDSITYRGYVSENEKKQLLADARAYILNSTGEAFGVALIEALASGTPVIGRDSGNIPNIVQNGEHGIIYGEGELHKAIESVSSMGISFDNNLLHRRAQEYDKEKSVERLETILHNI